MGQQQLLLIVLGVIIIGIAVVVGIQMFRANSIEQKRNLIINESSTIAAIAQQHYKKPISMGGGNRAFDNTNGGVEWAIPTSLRETANGTYTITSISSNEVVVSAVGTEVVTGNDPVEVEISILPENFNIQIIR